ncbi:MAG: DEDD exonuclease domain-containing protein [Acidimicrobiia bacterium]|nr:DEDD exonuclease domain-containing protein [Acidimicrobiia bacterium]
MAFPIQRTFDDLGTPLHEVTFCVLDLETTGATPASCEITEVGAVKYVAGELVGAFDTLVNPDAPIPPTITVLTGITQAMVIDAPRIAEVLPSLLEFIGNAVIVGHNVRFDMAFLNAAAERLGYGKLPNPTSDTLGLARRLLRSEVRRLNLSSLAAHFRSPVTPNHRAMADAQATAHVFWGLLERAGSLGVSHLEDLLRLPTAKGSPHYKKIELTEGLPRRPGVYLFRDRDDNVIYVGKAKNLRTRVRSYFYGDDRRSVAQMLRDLTRIEHRVCNTELEAEVTELRLIHASAPRYNRRSRPPRSPQYVKLTNEEFPRLSIVRRLRDDGCLHLGPFRSRRQANAVVAAIWDAVPIRRCLTKGGRRSPACNFAQLGVALCPCDGTVTNAEYQLVVNQLRYGIETRPDELLEPLVERIRDYARTARFEEAAEMRDRHRALSNAVHDRRSWNVLREAGLLWAEDRSGDSVLVERGRLLASWSGTDQAPLATTAVTAPSPHLVPESVAAAEEARLIWRWLDRPEVRIIETTRPLAMPRHRIPVLSTLAG